MNTPLPSTAPRCRTLSKFRRVASASSRVLHAVAPSFRGDGTSTAALPDSCHRPVSSCVCSNLFSACHSRLQDIALETRIRSSGLSMRAPCVSAMISVRGLAATRVTVDAATNCGASTWWWRSCSLGAKRGRDASPHCSSGLVQYPRMTNRGVMVQDVFAGAASDGLSWRPGVQCVTSQCEHVEWRHVSAGRDTSRLSVVTHVTSCQRRSRHVAHASLTSHVSR